VLAVALGRPRGRAEVPAPFLELRPTLDVHDVDPLAPVDLAESIEIRRDEPAVHDLARLHS
jgi:hypothetical protein